MKDFDKFLYDIIQLRKKYKFDNKNILNCDETAVCLNNPGNKTITKKGKKTVNVKTLKREKMRITVLLTITGDGKFLPPFIIFKGEPQSKLYAQIQKYDEVKNKKVFATTQKNAWIDDNTFKQYIKLVLEPYNQLYKKLLILDKCTTHIKDNIIFLLKNANYIPYYIPAGMTMVLQPLDRSINFPFKCYLKDKFTEYLLDNRDKFKESIEECRKRLIKNITEIINNTNVNNNEIGKFIRKDIIIKSFKICGITNAMSGDEDFLFDGFNVINQLTILKDRRLNENNNTNYYRYQRRDESDSSSEGEGSNDENLESQIDDISFI